MKVTGNNSRYSWLHCFIKGHANAVVKAMAGFSLSPKSIPEWAKVVPEEVWKNELLAGLKSKSNGR